MELHGSRLGLLKAKGEAINFLIRRWNKHEPLVREKMQASPCAVTKKKKKNFIQGLWIFLSGRVKGTWLFSKLPFDTRHIQFYLHLQNLATHTKTI